MWIKYLAKIEGIYWVHFNVNKIFNKDRKYAGRIPGMDRMSTEHGSIAELINVI